jgi:hypothetical protein
VKVEDTSREAGKPPVSGLLCSAWSVGKVLQCDIQAAAVNLNLN